MKALYRWLAVFFKCAAFIGVLFMLTGIVSAVTGILISNYYLFGMGFYIAIFGDVLYLPRYIYVMICKK